MDFTGNSHLANWKPGPLEWMGHNWEPVRAFAVMHYRNLNFIQKVKENAYSLCGINIDKIKSIRMIKNVIQIMGKTNPLVCMQIDLNRLEETHCWKTIL